MVNFNSQHRAQNEEEGSERGSSLRGRPSNSLFDRDQLQDKVHHRLCRTCHHSQQGDMTSCLVVVSPFLGRAFVKTIPFSVFRTISDTFASMPSSAGSTRCLSPPQLQTSQWRPAFSISTPPSKSAKEFSTSKIISYLKHNLS